MIIPKTFRRIHMVGIGGYGMSGIAEVLHNLGFYVTGSDIKKSKITIRLENLGITVRYGHSPENVHDAQVVVYSSAIRRENPELVEARKLKIPTIPRAEMLAELMRMKYSIAVSGAHGKTTTTWMIGTLLTKAGLSPTVVVGGRIRGLDTGAILGKSEYMVVEADESDASFLKLFPTLAVVTNIDKEHLDYYGNFVNLLHAFLEFIERTPFYGAGILNIDNHYTKDIANEATKRTITYGFSRDAMFRVNNPVQEGLTTHGNLIVHGESMGLIKVSMPGIHNLQNALASVAVAHELGVNIREAKDYLSDFSGVHRRFEIKGKRNGVTVVDDYGHHPTEISRVLESAREFWRDGKIIVVFQPHRYTRVSRLYREFAQSLLKADKIIVLPIYPAGEDPMEGIDEGLILQWLKNSGKKNLYHVHSIDEAVEQLDLIVDNGDLVITLGAGDVYKVGELWLGKEKH